MEDYSEVRRISLTREQISKAFIQSVVYLANLSGIVLFLVINSVQFSTSRLISKFQLKVGKRFFLRHFFALLIYLLKLSGIG